MVEYDAVTTLWEPLGSIHKNFNPISEASAVINVADTNNKGNPVYDSGNKRPMNGFIASANSSSRRLGLFTQFYLNYPIGRTYVPNHSVYAFKVNRENILYVAVLVEVREVKPWVCEVFQAVFEVQFNLHQQPILTTSSAKKLSHKR
jgi:hypothetical protein